MKLKLLTKPFSFQLLQSLKTAQGSLQKKKGWLIKLESESGKVGWGEISSFKESELKSCEKILKDLGTQPSREKLDKGINKWPGALGFAIGSAFAEIDSLIGPNSTQNWLTTSSSAILLPTENCLLLKSLESILDQEKQSARELTFKWKVATNSNTSELHLLKQILARLPKNTNLRIDANGGWNRIQARKWALELQNDPRLEWIEQPLPANDIAGLIELSAMVPIALDESLVHHPSLRNTWQSWQIRRPALEGDPRSFLKEMNGNHSYKVISTTFETGIGRRWIEHFAALQLKSNTPVQPGLAPGWCPKSSLFSRNPYLVWESA